MQKILYDIAPFHLSEKYKDTLYAEKMVGTAMCAPESCITDALREILTLFFNRFSGIVFIRTDEETILQAADYLAVNYAYKPMKPSGLLSYKLPEISFPLDSENLSYVIDHFAEFSSLEIHFAGSEAIDFVRESVKNHPYKITVENLPDILKGRDVILNKSGDADELECLIKEKHVYDVLEIFIKCFKTDKK